MSGGTRGHEFGLLARPRIDTVFGLDLLSRGIIAMYILYCPIYTVYTLFIALRPKPLLNVRSSIRIDIDQSQLSSRSDTV